MGYQRKIAASLLIVLNFGLTADWLLGETKPGNDAPSSPVAQTPPMGWNR